MWITLIPFLPRVITPNMTTSPRSLSVTHFIPHLLILCSLLRRVSLYRFCCWHFAYMGTCRCRCRRRRWTTISATLAHYVPVAQELHAVLLVEAPAPALDTVLTVPVLRPGASPAPFPHFYSLDPDPDPAATKPLYPKISDPPST